MQLIFKNYLILSIIIKQLLFSLFFSPSDPAVIEQPGNGIEIFSGFTINSSKNKIHESSRLPLLFDLFDQDAEEITTLQEFF